MSALDRVMRAYALKYPINSDQAVIVRRELARIIEDLLKPPRRAPVMLPESANDVGRRSVSGNAPDVADDTGRTVRVATDRL
jgi:hypothetical protein